MLNKRGFDKVEVLILLIAILFASVLIWNYFSGFLEKEELQKIDIPISGDEGVLESPNGKYFDNSGNELFGFFRKGTDVMMYDRTWEKIELLKEGDYVLGYDSSNGHKRFSKVLRIREFKLSGYNVLNDNLEATSNTLFLADGKWKTLDDVKLGSILLDYNDKELKVETLISVNNEAEFYNLQLDEPYTFYVRGGYASIEEDSGVAVPDVSHLSESYLVRSGV